MTIYAAGVICWREEHGNITFALVHREKYDDWGFAKGKQDPGEELCETAVREVEEELGLKVKLGRKISTIHYQVGSGEDKEVHYWASKVTDKILKRNKFVPNEEIARVEWHDAKAALKLLSYAHDKALLKQVLDLAGEGELETRALIVLRHAAATPRSEWKRGEAKRPLLPEGKAQALRLAIVLKAFGPKRLVTSPWERCRQTVLPYAENSGKKLISRSQLTELTNALSPRKTTAAVEDLFAQKNSALLCSHRPALPTIMQTLATRAVDEVKAGILAGDSLRPGEFMVLRMSTGKNAKFVAFERHYPFA
jgi:8-oxo-dGTP diphosphatase